MSHSDQIVPPITSAPGKGQGQGQGSKQLVSTMNRAANDLYDRERDQCLRSFSHWTQADQIDFVQHLLHQMCHYQHGLIDTFLKPMLQRDFLSLLPKSYLDHIAEKILSYLDARSLAACEAVCREWRRVISDGMLWKKLIERQVKTDTLWKGLSQRRGWHQFLFKYKPANVHHTLGPVPGSTHFLSFGSPLGLLEPYKLSRPDGGSNSPFMISPFFSTNQGTGPVTYFDQSALCAASLSPDHSFYHRLYPTILKDISNLESNWRLGKHALRRIRCRSENSKGVYCLQYDDHKIVSGLRDNTIKIWDFKTLECLQILTGHTGSVLCLQYDERIIVTGSSDATDMGRQHGEMLNTLIHHCEAVLHLRFEDGVMVTCSKDRSIAVWDMQSPTDITLRRVLVGHRAAVNVVDFDQKYIVSASGDRTIKVWDTSSCEFVRTLNGHKRGIACLQYRERLIVSGSSDYTIRLWDIECGACLRILEGHEELVRCIRFDNKRIVSGAYDGKIKVWDLAAALDPRTPAGSVCVRTLVEHTGRVFRLQFDEFQIVSSSHDDTILIWDFLNYECPAEPLGGLQTGPEDDSNNANDIELQDNNHDLMDRSGGPDLSTAAQQQDSNLLVLASMRDGPGIVIENAMMVDGPVVNGLHSLAQALRASHNTHLPTGMVNAPSNMVVAMEESQDFPSFSPAQPNCAGQQAQSRASAASLASYANGFTRASLTPSIELPYQGPQTHMVGTSCATYNTNFFRQVSVPSTTSSGSSTAGPAATPTQDQTQAASAAASSLFPCPGSTPMGQILPGPFDMFRRNRSNPRAPEDTYSTVTGFGNNIAIRVNIFPDPLADDTNDALGLDQEPLDDATFTNEEGSSPG